MRSLAEAIPEGDSTRGMIIGLLDQVDELEKKLGHARREHLELGAKAATVVRFADQLITGLQAIKNACAAAIARDITMAPLGAVVIDACERTLGQPQAPKPARPKLVLVPEE